MQQNPPFPLSELANEQTRLQSEYHHSIKGNNIIIVGPSGCGKSTLISHLLGKQLDVTFADRKFQINHNDADFKIGNSSNTSETTKCSSKQNDNTNLWDCPGFKATNGVNQDIITGYNLFYLLKYSQQYKIVLVLCLDCVQSQKYQGFIQILNQQTQYFGKQIGQVRESILLVITKVPQSQINSLPKKLKDEFKKMLDQRSNQNSQLSNDSAYMLDSIVVNFDSRVIICSKPDSINKTYHYKFDTNYFHNCIDKLTYCKTNNVKLSLDNQAQSQIQIQLNDLQKSVNSILIQLQHQLIQSHCNKDIKLELINIQNQDQQQDNNCTNSRYQIGLKALKQIFDNNQHDTIIQQTEELYNIINQINFIQDNILTLECQPFEIDQRLNALVNEAWKQIVEYYNIKSQQTETELCICGNIISLSDIIIEVSQYQLSSIDNIYVYCIDSILLDRSIQLTGINLTINAQKWSMSNIPIAIDLSGKDGEQHEQSKAANGQGYNAQGNGNDGADGLHGRHGKDGGNFIGIGKDYDDLKQLTIITSGGKGSNGQDGGDGSNGKDRTDDIKKINNRDQSTLVSRKPYRQQDKNFLKWVSSGIKLFGTYNAQFQEEYKSNGDNGGNGGDGGDAGLAGKNGQAGTISIEEYQQTPYTTIITQQNAKNGQPGLVGRGGLRHYYTGIYKNELIFSSFREKGKVYTQKTTGTENEQNQVVEGNTISQELVTGLTVVGVGAATVGTVGVGAVTVGGAATLGVGVAKVGAGTATLATKVGVVVAKVGAGAAKVGAGVAKVGVGVAKLGAKEITKHTLKYMCCATGFCVTLGIGVAAIGLFSAVSCGLGSEWLEKPFTQSSQLSLNGQVRQSQIIQQALQASENKLIKPKEQTIEFINKFKQNIEQRESERLIVLNNGQN